MVGAIPLDGAFKNITQNAVSVIFTKGLGSFETVDVSTEGTIDAYGAWLEAHNTRYEALPR